MNANHEIFMHQAVDQAAKALGNGEVPVGAIVVNNGYAIGTGFNQPVGRSDPTAHAEVIALRKAAHHVGNYRLTGATVYVTIEPCLMCAGAMVHARIGTLVFGALEPRTGVVRSRMRVFDEAFQNHRVEVVGGVLEEQCRSMIQTFFADRRKSL
jgi:tRNA(adenine34) deaminase